MVQGQMRLVLRHLRTLVRRPEEGASSDRALLERFAKNNDEAAFEELLRRHAALVLGVCRRVLANAPDVEDAFQATFLVLVRKASSLEREGSLAPWLYTVAYHVALRARGAAARRQREERQVSRMPTVLPEDLIWRDLRPVLDEELNRLPEKYRAPVVLCYLEGKTHEEAARELGWPRGTVAGRLARAKDILRRRLQVRGVTPLAVAADPLPAPTRAAVPSALLSRTLEASTLLLVGQGASAGAFSASVVALAEGALQALPAIRARTLLLSLLALALTTGGIGIGHSALSRGGREVASASSRAPTAPSPRLAQALAYAERPPQRNEPEVVADPATGEGPLPRVVVVRVIVCTEEGQAAMVMVLDIASGTVVAHVPWGPGEVPEDWLQRLTASLSGQARPNVGDVRPLSARDGSRTRTIPSGSRRAKQLGVGERRMAKPLLSDEVWEQIQSMLPAPKPRRARFPGRKPLDPRRVLTGIVFVLKTGIPWEELPVEMGCGCGMTCLNYLKAWQQNGLWPKMYEVLQAHLPGADRLDWSRLARDGLPGPKPVVTAPGQRGPHAGEATTPPAEQPSAGGGFFPGGGRENRWAAPLVAPAPMM